MRTLACSIINPQSHSRICGAISSIFYLLMSAGLVFYFFLLWPFQRLDEAFSSHFSAYRTKRRLIGADRPQRLDGASHERSGRIMRRCGDTFRSASTAAMPGSKCLEPQLQ
jgi:hypothetical protein